MRKDTYEAEPNTFNYVKLYDGTVLEIWTSEMGTTITFNNHDRRFEDDCNKSEKQEPLFEQLTHKYETFKADVSKLTTNNITFHYVDFIDKVVK